METNAFLKGKRAFAKISVNGLTINNLNHFDLSCPKDAN
jgi:hypothetical protein